MARTAAAWSALGLALALAGSGALAEEPAPAEVAPIRSESAPAWPSGAGVALTRRLPPEVTPSEDGLYLAPERGLGWMDRGAGLELRARAALALDARRYDPRNARSSGLRMDRALVGVEGHWGERVSGRLLADLRGTDTRAGLEEGWLSLELVPEALRLTGGLLRFPLGLEHTLAEETLPFVDYAFAGLQQGRHDLGATLEGELGEGLLSWSLGFATGQGWDAFGERRAGSELVARLTSYPLRWLDDALQLGPWRWTPLSGLFVSGGLAWTWDFRGHLDAATSLRNKVFLTRDDLQARQLWQWSCAWGLDLGPLRLFHEFGQGSLVGLRLPGGGRETLDRQLHTMSLSLAWRLTGEPYDSRPYRQRERFQVQPARPLYDPHSGRWGPGAWEVALRYSNGDMDRDLFLLGFTRYDESAQEFRCFDVAVNWWPVALVRVTFQLTRTIADQYPAVFDSHGRDTSFLFRVQLSF